MSTTFGNQGAKRNTVCVSHAWHDAYVSALSESDPDRLIGRIEYAIIAIERRYAQWGTDPGTPAERKAVQKCISTLKRLMRQEQVRRDDTILSTAFTEAPVARLSESTMAKPVEQRRTSKETNA